MRIGHTERGVNHSSRPADRLPVNTLDFSAGVFRHHGLRVKLIPDDGQSFRRRRGQKKRDMLDFGECKIIRRMLFQFGFDHENGNFAKMLLDSFGYFLEIDRARPDERP
jgi:hypothetical protein